MRQPPEAQWARRLSLRLGELGAVKLRLGAPSPTLVWDPTRLMCVYVLSAARAEVHSRHGEPAVLDACFVADIYIYIQVHQLLRESKSV